MTEDKVRDRLDEMLEQLTPGSVLHLLGEVLRADAEVVPDPGDAERLKDANTALFVFGLGLDASLLR